MNMRKILAAMLVVVMVLAMVPVTAQAADDTVYESGKLYLDKTAILENDGTYTIRLEAFATGSPVTTTTITGTPLDVVLVIDQSGSIYNDDYCEEIEEAVKAFINQLAENGKKIGKTHRVAVAGFSCGLWETGFTHSMGDEKHNYAVNLPLADGSYAQLWTNTGIFLSDGTFKSYQTFEFEEVPPGEETLVRTNMTVGGYRGNYTSNNWFDIEGFFTADGEQIQAKVSREWEWSWSGSGYVYTWQFQTKSDKALSFNVTNKDGANASVNSQETYTKTVVGGLPAYSSSNDPYHVFYGSYTHPVNGGTENREFPLYFVDDTETWPGQTVRRAIYRRSDGKFYYDFRTSNGHNENTNIGHIEVPDMDTRKVYKINYGTYNASTGMFEGGYLTEADYKNTFMNVTDGTAGSGNVTAALNQIASGLGASGATRTGTGMEMARQILENNPLTEEDKAEGRERVVVVFTDGVPGQSPFEVDEANAALAESAKIKDMVGTNENVIVYALGLFKENVAVAENANTFMNGLSSNYPDAESMDDVPATTTEDGKYYSKTTDVNELMNLFPTIVTESTSTSIDSVYLTEGSILRDIMGAGFLLTGETTISTFTETGTWTSTNDTHTEGTIAWSGTEVPGPYLHVEDPKTLTKPDVTDPIQIYNTNPGPNNDNVGGNFYETASGELNLSAPPTIDITGFDYEEEYLAFNKEGRRLIVTITGVEAQPDTVGYDKNNLTNHMQSGLWSPMKADRTRELVGNFPMPNTTFTDALYVLDYAKPMNIPLSDLKMYKADSLDEDAMNYFNPAVSQITEANGNVVLENGKLVYKPMTTAWDGYDTFYVFGESELSTITDYSSNRNGNLWSRVKVLPANNVYYEDTFIQSQNGVTVGIVYDGDSWTTTGAESGNQELPESGETNYGESPYEGDMPFGGVHGWEDYLADDTGYSDGSATTSSTAGATATFTFTGTGVDIYSYTDMKQGAVMASIYKGDHVPTQEEMDAAMSNEATLEDRLKVKALYSVVMDNFSLSGDYYQIPTLSLHEQYQRDENGNNVKENGKNVLVPLEHGTYTVKLTVVPKTDDADGDGTKTTRYTYTLDGIRIYNPIQNMEDDETVQKAYGEEELNASFVEVRDILLDAESFDGTDYGVVFLDQIPADDPENGSGDPSDQAGKETDKIGLYECYGPKNEVYLASGQSIAFIPREGLHYYVGLKSPTGEKVCVSIQKDGKEQLLEIDHTTDLYYEVTPVEGIVLIGNLGMKIYKDENGEDVYDLYDNLLSITKLKVTGPDGSEVEPADFFEPVDQPTVLRMVRTLRQEAAAPEEPEVPETDPTEPSAPDVEIENPTEPTEPETPEAGGNNHLWQLIGGVIGWIIGNIFG